MIGTMTGVVLEAVKQESKKEAGVYFYSLVIYEHGQKYRRQVTELKIGGKDAAEKFKVAEGLVGKIGSVSVESSEFDGKISYYFQGVAK